MDCASPATVHRPPGPIARRPHGSMSSADRAPDHEARRVARADLARGSSSELDLEIVHRAIERAEFWVIEFRDVDAEATVDRRDEVEEVHRIDIEGLAQ